MMYATIDAQVTAHTNAIQQAMTRAIAPMIAAQAAIAKAIAPMIAVLNKLNKTANMLTRAHAALIAICQRGRRFLQLSLRKVAAICRKVAAICSEVLNTDTRPAHDALLSRAHMANAPNHRREQQTFIYAARPKTFISRSDTKGVPT